MKRRIFALTALCLLVLSLSAHALEPRVAKPAPSLTFDGTTAVCKVNIYADSSSDKINATVKLWDGGTCLKTWTASDTSRLRFSETYSKNIQAGRTYQMTVDYIIAGRSYPRVSASATCRG